MSNSVDSDETALDLCCLQKPIIIACGSERAKRLFTTAALLLLFYFFYYVFLENKNLLGRRIT